MAQILESIKGEGGSIKVGTTGTISALMTRELEKPVKSTPQTRLSSSTQHLRKSLYKSSSSKTPDFDRKLKKSHIGQSSRIPMFGSDYIALERTPSREKNLKKGFQLVEIVDIKCGNSDRAWTRLKKLGFSKLSESII